MTHDLWRILHAGHGPISFLTYLSRVLLYLLAVAVIASGTRVGIGVVVAMTTDTATRSTTETHDR